MLEHVKISHDFDAFGEWERSVLPCNVEDKVNKWKKRPPVQFTWLSYIFGFTWFLDERYDVNHDSIGSMNQWDLTSFISLRQDNPPGAFTMSKYIIISNFSGLATVVTSMKQLVIKVTQDFFWRDPRWPAWASLLSVRWAVSCFLVKRSVILETNRYIYLAHNWLGQAACLLRVWGHDKRVPLDGKGTAERFNMFANRVEISPA